MTEQPPTPEATNPTADDETPAGATATADSPIEHVAEGVTKQWIHDGKILVMTMENPQRDTVDAWAEEMLRIHQAWPAAQRYLTLQDQSADSMTVTPYLRERAGEVDKDALKFAQNGKLALVFPNTITNQIMRLVAGSFGQRHRSVKRKFFVDRDDAIAWLLED